VKGLRLMSGTMSVTEKEAVSREAPGARIIAKARTVEQRAMQQIAAV
jgi:hypothetical protein